jgi:hypothetical protein
MVDQKIKMNVNETLELDYLVEEVSRDIVTINKSQGSVSDNYISKEKYIFDPQSTGTYELDINGQIIEIEVTDIPDSGISRWTFDTEDTESGTAIDSWNSNDGTINGATTGVSGANQTYTTNEAYDFDGSDDDVAITIPALTDFSLAAWAKSGNSSSTSEEYVIRLQDSNNDVFLGEKNGNWIFRIYDGSFQSATGTTIDSNWTFLCATFDGSNMTLYEDATEVATGTASGTGSSSGSSAIGSNPGNGQFWNGRIDDPRIYSKELTSTEVSNLYQTGSING